MDASPSPGPRSEIPVEPSSAHPMLDRLAVHACRIADADAAAVMLRDEHRPGTAVAVASHGIEDLQGRRFDVGAGLSGRVMEAREPLVLTRYNAFGRRIDHPEAERTHAAIGAPILIDGAVRGAVVAGATRPEVRYGEREKLLMTDVADLAAQAIENAELREELERSLRVGVELLAMAVDMRDSPTGRHAGRVVELASRVGERLGMSEPELVALEFAARLHDVGKIGIPDAVLRKPGPLDDDEWRMMRRHPTLGADMVAHVPGLDPVADAVRTHHERWDGNGYPEGLRGEDIPLPGRIIAVCDAFHAMTSDRPYRRAMPEHCAAQELLACAGTQFDPAVVEAFVSVIDAPALSR